MNAFTPTSDGFVIDGDPTSSRAALPNIPSHGGVVRLKMISGNGYYKFGDSTVTVSATDGVFMINGEATDYVGIPAGATYLACFGGNMNVTVGHL